MNFSSQVIDAIAAASRFDLRRRSSAAKALDEAASNAQDERDSHILKTLSGVLSMHYSVGNHEFSPSVIWMDGSHSFSIEDIGPADADLLESAALCTDSTWIRARFLHAAWLVSNNHQDGQAAVVGYIELFEELFDPARWTKCNDAIQCAFHIASRLGKKSELYKQTRAVINQKLAEMNGEDPLFLSLALLKPVIKDATESDLNSYLPIITKLAAKNINVANSNTNLADNTFAVQEKLLKRLKQEDELITAKVKYAGYYEGLAESLAEKAEYTRAVIMLKKACTHFAEVDRDKCHSLRLRLEELQKLAMSEMQRFPIHFDGKAIYDFVERLFDGLSLEETIVQFGRMAKIEKVENVKQQVLEGKEEPLSLSLFGMSLLNQAGQTVQELPPLRRAGENTADPDVLHKHMVHYVARKRGLVDSIELRCAFEFVKALGDFSEDALDFLVCDNAIIPDNRAEIIRTGLYLGLTGKLYTAMHILLPQTENIFRSLVKICGDTVTFLKEDGSEVYKPLSALLKSEKLRECYSDDIIFAFQSIMEDPGGENLRNLTAHGLLEPQKGNSAVALHFLAMLIWLLAMYSMKSKKIIGKLAEKDRAEDA